MTSISEATRQSQMSPLYSCDRPIVAAKWRMLTEHISSCVEVFRHVPDTMQPKLMPYIRQ